MSYMKKHSGQFARSIIFASLALGAASTSASPTYKVTNGQDFGPGSLRAGLESGARKIAISHSVSTINIEDTLTYAETGPLEIRGSGQTIDGGGYGATLLEISNGANLSISNLSFTDGGNFKLGDGGGEGILLKVPTSRTGTVHLKLSDVTVSGVGDIGVHVLDCDIADCGNGNGGGGDGSPASVNVSLSRVKIDNVGQGSFDADGLRVDERGAGDIVFRASNSSFTNIGADGVELDEGDAGDVKLSVRKVEFSDNGAYCAGVDIDNPQDALCVEDGELDLDDGFDVDEAGEGSIVGRITNVMVKDNLDEGLDFDEAGDGGFDITLINVRAFNNEDEGIKLSAEDNGDLKARLHRVVVTDSGDDGVQIEQDGDGVITVNVTASVISDNKKHGLKVEQTLEQPMGALKIRGSNIGDVSTENVDEI